MRYYLDVMADALTDKLEAGVAPPILPIRNLKRGNVVNDINDRYLGISRTLKWSCG